MGSSITFLIMNMDSWNNLSPELQQALDSTIDWARQDIIKTWTDSESLAIQFSKEKGIEFINLPSDEYARWDAAVKPVYDKMAADMNAAGYPGTELVNYAMERSTFYANK
jgi:TRAP-type transport system periplasmic protein